MMANTPVPNLFFVDACSDCGYREVELPEPLPFVGDDFDWLVRDYDGFRLSMLEEMAARFPERRRWTPADMEVVLVESLSVVLDQLSDMLDRVHSEAFLETARRPESVRRLLNMLGFDAVSLASEMVNIPDPTGTLGEDTEQKRQRLVKFQRSFNLYLAEYPTEVNTLTLAQQDELAIFIDNPLVVSDSQLDAVQQFLDSAPEFVKRSRNAALERYWQLHPREMNLARAAGPRAIHTQKRMVTEADYAARMQDHPLVLRANTYSQWTGSWNSLFVAAVLTKNIQLDSALHQSNVGTAQTLKILQDDIDHFNHQRELDEINWIDTPTPRAILRPFLDAYRMAGQEVFLQDAERVGINISLSVRVAGNFFQSEVRRVIQQALGQNLGGFFAPGKLRFGEDLHSSDIIETVMSLDGVEAVCLNRFKRVGRRYPDQADSGLIRLDGLEIAMCSNDPLSAELGVLRIVLHGGSRG
jgi:hypothetical protein